jgi:hypothetical protein
MTTARSSLAIAAALASAACACVIGLWFGTYSAADTDPYGYVSQADLISAGSIRITLDPATFPDIPGNAAAWAPAGYVITRDRGAVVPMYPPGLPLVMALAQRVTGARSAVFYVVPLLAALAVLATCALGAKADHPASGAMAAVLLATMPVFVLNTLQPVSDVPATAWWTAACVLVLCDTPALCLLAGLSASLAVMTRPHLVPLAAVLGIYLVVETLRAERPAARLRLWRLMCFTLGAVPGCLAIAALNQYLHGSPLLSGYGALRDLFRLEHIVPNLDRYPRWLLQTAPLVYLALLSPVAARWPLGDRLRPRAAGLLMAWSGVIVLLTCFYGYFGRDEWGYTRLLLPAFPALLVLGAATLRRFVAAIPLRGRASAAAVAILTAAVAFWQLRATHQLGVFGLSEVEQRYADVGAFIASATSPNAVFISGLHSGSIRYYSNRATVYYPRLRQGSLDLAIQTLHARGRDVFIVLEDGERPIFSARFSTSAFAQLDWPPSQRTSRGVPVSIWNLRDREAFLTGAAVATRDIHRVPVRER